MRYDPERHHRRSIRLQGYDYSQAGLYFVTICTMDRECLFGDVIDGQMRPSSAGMIVQQALEQLPARFSHVTVDQYIVMPNHVHAIIALSGLPTDVSDTPATTGSGHPAGLGEIICAFKASTTRSIRLQTTSSFGWQRNYYEHIIRNEQSLQRILQYIVDNPARWSTDAENPTIATPIDRHPL